MKFSTELFETLNLDRIFDGIIYFSCSESAFDGKISKQQ